MGLALEILLLFFIIFFAVRFATTGHADNMKMSEPPQEEIVFQDPSLVS